ncbi:MAG: L-ribulose-5-phosphate 4-epimerase [Liquorilactobacillus hordei]|uniref:L-ribulose-5-phosphate 4-epimerase n=1 Tax=Liquorilactobacillus hordei TaxID=468911 RepID=UPI0039E83038
MLEQLKQQVYEANMELTKLKLVSFTWGNVSGIDRKAGCFVIKPSGVEYERLQPSDLVVVNMDGQVVEGKLNPSSDTPTHLVLYKKFADIGGIAHTHSPWAVSFATAGRDIPVMNTTHADTFYGDIPVSRQLTKKEVESGYEKNTGNVIVETFKNRNLANNQVKGIVVRQHGPFTWGDDPLEAVYNAKVLETVAEMDYHTLNLNPDALKLEKYLLNKHYLRKHGASAYYGQN